VPSLHFLVTATGQTRIKSHRLNILVCVLAR